MALIFIAVVAALLRFFDVDEITALWVILGCVSVGMLVEIFSNRRSVKE